ncbi:MAG: hypothetical protein ACREEK_24395 [Bradyrhizobium sp.]
MATDTIERSHWPSARWLLLLLVAIPLLPEMFIWTVGALAGLMGCEPGQKSVCLIGSLAVSSVIEGGLSAAGILSPTWSHYFNLAVAAWLVVCLVVLIRGWGRMTSRLLLGLAVALFLTVVPNLGPLFAIRLVADASVCKPESTGCLIFGGEVRNAYGALEKANLAFFNGDALPVVGVFLVFAAFVVVSGVTSTRRTVKS